MVGTGEGREGGGELFRRMIPPVESLVKYDKPVLVSSTKDKAKGKKVCANPPVHLEPARDPKTFALRKGKGVHSEFPCHPRVSPRRGGGGCIPVVPWSSPPPKRTFTLLAESSSQTQEES